MESVNASGRELIHVCTTKCQHGGPIYCRWPWKNKGGIEETWNPDPQKSMPVGIAVSMGAYCELLGPPR